MFICGLGRGKRGERRIHKRGVKMKQKMPFLSKDMVKMEQIRGKFRWTSQDKSSKT